MMVPLIFVLGAITLFLLAGLFRFMYLIRQSGSIFNVPESHVHEAALEYLDIPCGFWRVWQPTSVILRKARKRAAQGAA